jgi:hypothetical protein
MARRHRTEAPARKTGVQPWWAAKRYGYGANLPIAWQGWAVMLAWLSLLAGAGILLLPGRVLAFLAVTLVATALFLVIVRHRTRGGWRWRWGEEA